MSTNQPQVMDAELVYRQFLDDETKALVDSLDDGERAYFWTYLKEEMPRMLSRSLMDEMERAVIEGLSHQRPKGIAAGEPVAKPFEHAEHSLRPGRWFTRTAMREVS